MSTGMSLDWRNYGCYGLAGVKPLRGFDGFGLVPEALEIVEEPGFFLEDMYDEVAEVHQYPLGVVVPLYTERQVPSPLELEGNLVANGLGLARVGRRADDEEVGEGSPFTQIQDPDVGSLLGFGCANRDEPRLLWNVLIDDRRLGSPQC